MAAGGASIVAEETPAADFTSTGDESVSPRADESILAAPFAAVAAEDSPLEQDAPAHIPESFADRLERDSGSRAFERVEPRMAHAVNREAHEVEAESHVLRNRPMRPRGGAWRAPVALAVLVAIAGAGYYAYKHDAPGIDRLAEFALAGRHANEPASAERTPSQEPAAVTGSNGSPPAAAANDAPAGAPPMGAQAAQDAPNAPATTVSDAQPASESNPAAAALVSMQPGSPGRSATDAENAATSSVSGAKARARPSSATTRNDDEAAGQRGEPASRSRRQADADAIATQRLIARDLGTATAPPVNAPAATLDRDAAATQRLIERDLGPFLHRNDGSPKGAANPAIH